MINKRGSSSSTTAVSTDILVLEAGIARAESQSSHPVTGNQIQMDDDTEEDELTMPDPIAMPPRFVGSTNSAGKKRGRVGKQGSGGGDLPLELKAYQTKRRKKRQEDSQDDTETPPTRRRGRQPASKSRDSAPQTPTATGNPPDSSNPSHETSVPQLSNEVSTPYATPQRSPTGPGYHDSTDHDPLTMGSVVSPPAQQVRVPLTSVLQDLIRTVGDYASDIDRTHVLVIAERDLSLHRLASSEAERVRMSRELEDLRKDLEVSDNNAKTAMADLTDALEQLKNEKKATETLRLELESLSEVRNTRENLERDLALARKRHEEAVEKAINEVTLREEVEAERDRWKVRYEGLKNKLTVLTADSLS
ncbi:hypothetical protein HDU93_009493 [Gonapodya sp. JEL0774]|nr:hypothetical protein HDU93_009493 [Gonapodya sp. JEL0774]